MINKNKFQLPEPKSIGKIQMSVTQNEVSLAVHYNDAFAGEVCENLLYDRIGKRYYVLRKSPTHEDKLIKQRIKENDYHVLFEIYLQGERG